MKSWKLSRDRAAEVLEYGPDEAADGDWRWLVRAQAEDVMALLEWTKALEGQETFRECIRDLMRMRGIKTQKELVGRMRAETGSTITENALSECMRQERLVPQRFFRELAAVLKLTREEKARLAWAYIWGK